MTRLLGPDLAWWALAAVGLAAPVVLLLVALLDRPLEPPRRLSPDLPLTSVCNYWVAPEPHGSDDAPGTRQRPWATLEHAAMAVPDHSCTVWFEDGVYTGGNHVVRRFDTTTTFRAAHPYRAVLEADGQALDIDGASHVIFQGLQFRHVGPDATGAIVYVDRGEDGWAEHITFRDNIIHDSYDDDLLKIYNGVRFAVVEGNVFYNQGRREEHIDVNSVTDVLIQDNIFFNDFAASGRDNDNETNHYITVKDSNGDDDDLEGSERVTIARNIFTSWEGGLDSFVNVGNDGKAYHEAREVRVENNLVLGNSSNLIDAPFSVAGAADVVFANNTVVGDLPTRAYAFRVYTKGENPQNERVVFANNIWSDPTGTMGADGAGSDNNFSGGDAGDTTGLLLLDNLYWNGGAEVPAGGVASPLVDDPRRVVADPLLRAEQHDVVEPHWTQTHFTSGAASIREEFVRLVMSHGQIGPDSPAVDRGVQEFAPADDILGRPRDGEPDLGALEVSASRSELEAVPAPERPRTASRAALGSEQVLGLQGSPGGDRHAR